MGELGTGLSLLVAATLLVAAVRKVQRFDDAERMVRALTAWRSRVVAAAVVMVEVVLAIVLVLAPEIGAWTAGLFLIGATVALSLLKARGAGCSCFGRAQSVGWWPFGRNVVLVTICGWLVAEGASSTVSPVVAALVVGTVVIVAVGGLSVREEFA